MTSNTCGFSDISKKLFFLNLGETTCGARASNVRVATAADMTLWWATTLTCSFLLLAFQASYQLTQYTQPPTKLRHCYVMCFGIVRSLVYHTFGRQETPSSNSMLSLSRFQTKRNGWGSPFFVQGRALGGSKNTNFQNLMGALSNPISFAPRISETKWPIFGVLGVPKMALRVPESKFWDHFQYKFPP